MAILGSTDTGKTASRNGGSISTYEDRLGQNTGDIGDGIAHNDIFEACLQGVCFTQVSGSNGLIGTASNFQIPVDTIVAVNATLDPLQTTAARRLYVLCNWVATRSITGTTPTIPQPINTGINACLAPPPTLVSSKCGIRSFGMASTVSSRGFSLIELMIVVIVAGVFAALAIPSFNASIRNNRILSATSNLVTAINQARTEAITRRQQVTVCASADGATCSNNPAWDKGWIIFIDTGSKTATSVVASDINTLLQVWPAVNASNAIVASNQFVRFEPVGNAVIDGIEGATTPATFTVKSQSPHPGDIERNINVTPFGRTDSRHN